jgi:hypothetical protein
MPTGLQPSVEEGILRNKKLPVGEKNKKKPQLEEKEL